MNRVNTRASRTLKRSREPSPPSGSGQVGQPPAPSRTRTHRVQKASRVSHVSDTLATGTSVGAKPHSQATQPSQPAVTKRPAANDSTPASNNHPLRKQTNRIETERPAEHAVDCPRTKDEQRLLDPNQLCKNAACQLRLAPDPGLAYFDPTHLALFEQVNNDRLRLADALSITTSQLRFNDMLMTVDWPYMMRQVKGAYNNGKLNGLQAEHPESNIRDFEAFNSHTISSAQTASFSYAFLKRLQMVNCDRLLLANTLSVPVNQLWFHGEEMVFKWDGMVSEIMSASKSGRLNEVPTQYLTLPLPDDFKPDSADCLTDSDREDILMLVTSVVPRARHWAAVERMMNDETPVRRSDVATLVMDVNDDLGEQLFRFAQAANTVEDQIGSHRKDAICAQPVNLGERHHGYFEEAPPELRMLAIMPTTSEGNTWFSDQMEDIIEWNHHRLGA
ncbi:hypothetical protein BGZ61DRAFT_574593 [Ilyonectria robusta]|uniref:uncharacterized protein n=1 Tax=Ilyonectria robusta TaxID=1079257 RepID=UPI001E8D1BDB|nr:uncharacterized protein BGZ61DRAFT_574593 [Ilyonectria robusta]KAH8714608.1 hypothetical protein BGZ61DRAFT_574593 [Ilyonectria robusta]